MEESKYIVSLWPGIGYYTKRIKVMADSEEQALERAVGYCERNNLNHLYFLQEEVYNLGLNDDEIAESFLYIDATLECSDSYPVYVYVENLGVEKVS